MTSNDITHKNFFYILSVYASVCVRFLSRKFYLLCAISHRHLLQIHSLLLISFNRNEILHYGSQSFYLKHTHLFKSVMYIFIVNDNRIFSIKFYLVLFFLLRKNLKGYHWTTHLLALDIIMSHQVSTRFDQASFRWNIWTIAILYLSYIYYKDIYLLIWCLLFFMILLRSWHLLSFISSSWVMNPHIFVLKLFLGKKPLFTNLTFITRWCRSYLHRLEVLFWL